MSYYGQSEVHLRLRVNVTGHVKKFLTFFQSSDRVFFREIPGFLLRVTYV